MWYVYSICAHKVSNVDHFKGLEHIVCWIGNVRSDHQLLQNHRVQFQCRQKRHSPGWAALLQKEFHNRIRVKAAHNDDTSTNDSAIAVSRLRSTQFPWKMFETDRASLPRLNRITDETRPDSKNSGYSAQSGNSKTPLSTVDFLKRLSLSRAMAG